MSEHEQMSCLYCAVAPVALIELRSILELNRDDYKKRCGMYNNTL